MALILVAALVLGASQLPADSTLGHRIQAYLDRVGAAGFSGTVLVASGDSVLARGAWGVSDRRSGTAMTAGTAFDVGSLAQQFTATAALLLQGAQLLSVADSIGKYFPEAPRDKSATTLDQLLTHTAGLAADPGLDAAVGVSRDVAVERILAAPLAGPVGRFRRSDAGYVVLAAIIEKAAGHPFQQIVRGNIFDRSGMTATGFGGDSVWRSAPVASGYLNGEDRGSPAARTAAWGRLGAGGVISSSGDLFRFMRELVDARILSQGQLAEMFAPLAVAGDDSFSGFGWSLATSPLGQRIGNASAGPGGNAELAYYPERDLLVIALSNEITKRMLFGRLPVAIHLPATELSRQLAANIASGDFDRLPSPTLSAGKSGGAVALLLLGLAIGGGWVFRWRAQRKAA
jgi:CubicO group peptidase (beta-lactamase class C family)